MNFLAFGLKCESDNSFAFNKESVVWITRHYRAVTTADYMAVIYVTNYNMFSREQQCVQSAHSRLNISFLF